MSKDLKPALIRAFYGFMEMETEGYEMYMDTPENRFEYDPESIWIVNPKTERWMIVLKKSGKLLYYYGVYDNFSKWFNEGLSVFEQLITMWLEDVLKRGVSTTHFFQFDHSIALEDVLKRGVSTTSTNSGSSRNRVEDVLKRGVSTTATCEKRSGWVVEEVIKRGISSI